VGCYVSHPHTTKDKIMFHKDVDKKLKQSKKKVILPLIYLMDMKLSFTLQRRIQIENVREHSSELVVRNNRRLKKTVH
jgi:hypothetical protein